LRTFVLASVLFASTATAQPAIDAPLADIRDEKALALALNAITQDPAIAVRDPAHRELAQSLMSEGIHQFKLQNFDQALANFLEAYGKFPSPKILLNIGSTLRDMGRPAEAANTYQRYLLDPATSADRVAEVKDLLNKLDQSLTILTIRVDPRGSELSIDGGPFIAVGTSLQTRARPGLHLIRIRKDGEADEITVNGFEGENKDVPVKLTIKHPVVAPPPDPTAPPPPPMQENHSAWMEENYHYTRDDSNPNGRYYRVTSDAPSLPPLLETPHDDAEPPDPLKLHPEDHSISSGAVAVVRIDGKGRGAAGGLGIAIARDRFEGELMVLRSSVTGGYIGGRVRILTGLVRPYVGVGMPIFVFDHEVAQMNLPPTMETRVAVGVRAAAGVELYLNGHLSVQADLGGEYFFNVSGTRYEATAFVPTIGVIGRL